MNYKRRRRNKVAKNSEATASTDREIVLTRVFAAPRRLVFETWTKPEHLVRWLGPRGFTLPACEMDFRPGGAFRHCMRSPAGRDYWSQGVYREIVEPERIVFTDFFVDEEGNPARHPELPDWPLETLVTVTFAEHESKTKLTLQQVVTSATALGREGAQQGWTESLDRLGEYVAARAHS